MNLLVAGARRADAGKTTVASGLVAHTGWTAVKPRAGNDYWYSHGHCREALAEGRLYGHDAATLAAANPGEFEPEALNPVHRLWQPSPGSGTGLLGQEYREFVVDRAGDAFVVNGTVEIPTEVREALPLADAPVVRSVEELNDATERYHLPAQAALSERIDAMDGTVVESYADVARPLTEPAPDAVAVVEPGRIRLYRGDRYATACEVATGGPREGTLETRVSSVTELVEPVASYAIDPLGPDQRSDPAAVADAYEEAFEHLVAIAEGDPEPAHVGT